VARIPAGTHIRTIDPAPQRGRRLGMRVFLMPGAQMFQQVFAGVQRCHHGRDGNPQFRGDFLADFEDFQELVVTFPDEEVFDHEPKRAADRPPGSILELGEFDRVVVWTTVIKSISERAPDVDQCTGRCKCRNPLFPAQPFVSVHKMCSLA
jgi:hypothetical protein